MFEHLFLYVIESANSEVWFHPGQFREANNFHLDLIMNSKSFWNFLLLTELQQNESYQQWERSLPFFRQGIAFTMLVRKIPSCWDFHRD